MCALSNRGLWPQGGRRALPGRARVLRVARELGPAVVGVVPLAHGELVEKEHGRDQSCCVTRHAADGAAPCRHSPATPLHGGASAR